MVTREDRTIAILEAAREGVASTGLPSCDIPPIIESLFGFSGLFGLSG